MKVADPTNTQFDGQPSPVPIAKPTNVPAGPLPLAGATPAQALPGGIPQVNTPTAPVADPYLGSQTMAGSQSNAGDAERAYQQATNPAVGGNDANIPAAAQVYQQTIDPTQSYVPTQQVQDAQQIAQSNPVVTGGGPTLPLAPTDTTPTMPIQPPVLPPVTPPVTAPVDLGGQGNPGGQNVADALPLAEASGEKPAFGNTAFAQAMRQQGFSGSDMVLPGDPFYQGTPGQLRYAAFVKQYGPDGSLLPVDQATDTGGQALPSGLPLAAPAPSALDSAPTTTAPIPLATSVTPSGVPISNQDLTGATIGGAPTPTPIAPTAQTNFANDLTGKTLGVGQTPDRLALAQSMFDTFQKQSDPAYQAAVREAESNGAALGQLGSGGLRTSVGNLAAQRNLALEGERQNLTNSALEGSIGDAYKNVGIDQQQQGFQAGQKDAAFGQQAQQQGVQNATNQFNTGVAQQQQGFQTGQQGTAFDQAAREAQIQEALTNGDFNRALTLYNAGNQNSPNLALAADYTGQANQAGQAASGLVQNAVGNANTQIPAWLLPYLQQNGQTPQTPSAIPLAPTDPWQD